MKNLSKSKDLKLSNFSRPGSGRGGEQQYNAWDRSSRPGSGRGLNNSSASPGCVSASSNSSTPSMSPTSPSSSSAGGQLGLVPEHRIRNIGPPTNLPIVPGLKNFFFFLHFSKIMEFTCPAR